MHQFRAAERGDSLSHFCLGARSKCYVCTSAVKPLSAPTRRARKWGIIGKKQCFVDGLPFAYSGTDRRPSKPLVYGEVKNPAKTTVMGPREGRRAERRVKRRKARRMEQRLISGNSEFELRTPYHFSSLLARFVNVLIDDNPESFIAPGYTAGVLDQALDDLSMKAVIHRRRAKAWLRKLKRRILKEKGRGADKGKSVVRSADVVVETQCQEGNQLEQSVMEELIPHGNSQPESGAKCTSSGESPGRIEKEDDLDSEEVVETRQQKLARMRAHALAVKAETKRARKLLRETGEFEF